MASLDPIYISSDEEGCSSKRGKRKKGGSIEDHALRPRARAKSVNFPRAQHVEAIKRSSSTTGVVRVQPFSHRRLEAVTKSTISPVESKTVESTPATLDLYPPIEPLHFPERYRIAQGGEISIPMDGHMDTSVVQARITPPLLDKPNNDGVRSSDDSPADNAGKQMSQPPNLLKRKHDQATTEPPKRPRTTAPTYIPRHLPYHPPIGPAHKVSPRNHAPYYSSSNHSIHPRIPLSNRTLWTVPAYDPRAEINPAKFLSAPTATPSSGEKLHNPTLAGTEQQPPRDPVPKTRKRQWNCGMIADLGTELQRTFDALAFSTKHGMDVREVHKVFAVYVHQPLSAFSARGVSRAKMKEFKEKMKEHDKKLKTIATVGDVGRGRGRGKKGSGERIKAQGQEPTSPGRLEATEQSAKRQPAAATTYREKLPHRVVEQ